MKNVVPIRRNLGFRTFFNVLGPLISPAQPRYNCLGTYDLKMMRLYNYIYQTLETNFTIVHSLDGYDEISLTAKAKVMNNGGEQLYSPEAMGFNTISPNELSGGETVADAAKIFSNLLNNEATEAQKNAVIINAAFAINFLTFMILP